MCSEKQLDILKNLNLRNGTKEKKEKRIMLKTLHIPFVPINFVDVEMDYILKNLHSGNHVKRTILTTFLHGEEEAFTVNFFPL